MMMEGNSIDNPLQCHKDSETHNLTENSNQKARTNENRFKRRNKSQQQTKRRNSTNSNFQNLPYAKRRRRAHSDGDSILPNHFLLGGNMSDPLNLNSLLDEEVNRTLNAVTPKSSPLPSRHEDCPIEILIPRDSTDPLNLNGSTDCCVLAVPYKPEGKRRHRHRHHRSSQSSRVAMSQMSVAELSETGVNTSSSEISLKQDPSTRLQLFKEPNSVGTASGELHKNTIENSSIGKEEVTPISVENPPSGVPQQHPGKRKRRRNSNRSEHHDNRSATADKSISENKNFQSRSGSETGPGFRQNQQPHNQGKSNRVRYPYGNYSHYYGYRNPGSSEDPRTRIFLKEWFEGKEVLDLGCNAGHITLYVAKNLRPSRIMGIDIDGSLIHAARKNIRYYLSEMSNTEARHNAELQNNEQEATGKNKDENEVALGRQSEPAECVSDKGETSSKRHVDDTKKSEQEMSRLPVSLPITKGPIAPPCLIIGPTIKPGEFPSNVSFLKANYVLQDDQLLLTQRPEYDVIMCLSVTKWIQLNWGDSGLKRVFKRIYRHLRPGGILILEPQPWESYLKRKKLTDNIKRHFKNISLKPERFPTYLTEEVGFTRYEYNKVQKPTSKGFQRPVYIFYK